MPEDQTTRRRLLQAVGSAAVAGLAGCDTSGRDADSTPTPAGGVGRSTDQPSSTVRSTQTHTHTDDSPDATPTEFVRNQHVEYDDEALHATLTETVDVPADEVLVGYHLLDGPLPFTTDVYHAPPDATVGATETYDTQDLSAVSLLPDDPQPLHTVKTDARDIHYGTTPVGDGIPVTLVAQHDENLVWTAFGRSGYPYDGHGDSPIGVDCYCGGDIYEVPAGGTWARIIRLVPSDEVDPGTGMVVSWTSGPT